MASRRQKSRKARRTRVEAPPAELPELPEPGQGAAGEKAVRKESRTRFGKWADQIEATYDERPPAPWGSFPLGAISVFIGLVLVVIGLINANPTQLAIGVGLGMLGGLELAIREHFTGFRSHTTLLAGFIFVVAVGATFYAAHWILWQSLLLGALLFGAAFWLLRKRFEKASGGLAYKLR